MRIIGDSDPRLHGNVGQTLQKMLRNEPVVVVVDLVLSRLLYLAVSANLGLLCMPHPGMGPLA